MSLPPTPRRRQYPRRGDKCASNPQWDNEPLELKRTLVCWACLPLVDNSLRLRSKPCVKPRPWTKDARVRRTKFCISQATRTHVQHLPISSSSLSNRLLHPFSSISIHPLLFCPLCRKNGCSSSRATRKRGETWATQPKALRPPAPQATGDEQEGAEGAACQGTKDHEPTTPRADTAANRIIPPGDETADKENEKQGEEQGEAQHEHHVEEVDRLAQMLAFAMSRPTATSDSPVAPTARFWRELQAKVESIRTRACSPLVAITYPCGCPP
jgi:hypothetical protein